MSNIDINEEIKDRVVSHYYDMQNFDFGDFPPQDETHYLQIKEEFFDGIEHNREMSREKIIELAVLETLKYLKRNENDK